MHDVQQPSRRPGLIGPLILIGLGLLFLFANMGILTWSAWEALIQLWPVLLVAAGLELLIGRRYPWTIRLIALATIAVLIGGILLLPGMIGATSTANTIVQPLEAAERANVTVNFGAGTLTVSGHSASAHLLEVDVEQRAGEEIHREFRLAGATAIFTLQSRQNGLWFGRSSRGPSWDVRLNQDVPIQLTIATGAGLSTLDLHPLQLTGLAVNTGAGRTFITLPHNGVLDATISTGAGQAVITIPSSMAARIHVSTGIGSTDVQGNYRRVGDHFVSPGYDTAANRVDLDVRGGVGTIVIREQHDR